MDGVLGAWMLEEMERHRRWKRDVWPALKRKLEADKAEAARRLAQRDKYGSWKARRAAILAEFDAGMSYREIAAKHEISVSRVGALLRKARQDG